MPIARGHPICESRWGAEYVACIHCGCEKCGLAVEFVKLRFQPWFMQSDIHITFSEDVGFQNTFTVEVSTAPWTKYRFDIYKTPNHDFSLLPASSRKATRVDTSSPQSLGRAKVCLGECLQNHKCSIRKPEDTVLPRRVLDLQASNPSRISLYKTNDQKSIYACLSHRLGTSQPLRTVTTNKSRQCSGICEDELPRTFLDAIAVARYLDIRYVWIDSLCIVQDDSIDWKHEASLLAQTYSGAIITMAATASDGATSGLFRLNSGVVDRELSAVTGDSDHEGSFITGEELEKGRLHGFAGRPELLTRGWPLQKRLLSPRILHFNKEIVFECNRQLLCECPKVNQFELPPFLAPKNTCDESKLQVLNIPELYKQWRFILKQYSTMRLTFDSDVLPAISGLARNFHKYRGGNYAPGLWESQLLQELTWISTTTESCTRRDPWVAPTFS
ncbi:HET-domain-containing protein [Ophiobolus disseminans]|uniref:HET-domain-containing protein n=1 Tax=Ophiobolus disseminans TaxID=1469910 RepID=A0A6A6ZBB3_9PLEO|nr:HET-domain-containing protein [Ophiobolus disseminans]